MKPKAHKKPTITIIQKLKGCFGKNRRRFNNIGILDSLLHYYQSASLAPIRKTTNGEWKYSKFFTPLYAASRTIMMSVVFYDALLISGALQSFHADFTTLGRLDASMWCMEFLMFNPIDKIFLNMHFLHNFDKALDLFHGIKERKKKKTGKMKAWNLTNLKSLRFILFSAVLDYYEVYSVSVGMYTIIESDSSPYSISPWKNPVLKFIAWFVVASSIAILNLSLSAITTFPGVLAYHAEECLQVITEEIKEKTRSYRGGITNGMVLEYRCEKGGPLKDYERLFYVMREMNKAVGRGLMLFCLIYGTQQASETFCVFTLLRMGPSAAEDLKFLLIDVLISIGRIIYMFDAVSAAYNGSRKFRKAFEAYQCVAIHRERRAEIKYCKRKLNSIPDISMRIGHFECKSDALLHGMDLFLNIYFSAALCN